MAEEVSEVPVEPEPATSPQPETRSWLPKCIPCIILGLLLLGGATYAGYWYGAKSAKLPPEADRPLADKTENLTPTETPAVSPTPTLDPTADWKTYRNSKYGFGLKYPKRWFLQEYTHDGELSFVVVDPGKLMSLEELEPVDKPLGLITIYPSGGRVIGYEKFEDVNIGQNNNIQAKMWDRINTNAPNPFFEGKHEISYYIKRKGEYITIRYLSGPVDTYLAQFNQILSTFKFLD